MCSLAARLESTEKIPRELNNCGAARPGGMRLAILKPLASAAVQFVASLFDLSFK